MNFNKYRNDFPILKQSIHGKPLVYLDTSSSSQKPACVVDAMSRYYYEDHANVHRGMYTLSERATHLFEEARKKMGDFIRAKYTHEIIFTRGATEGINLVAQSYGRHFLKKGDEILLSAMEHHSNIVPWQLLQADIGITLTTIPLLENGELDMDAYEKLFSVKTRLVAIVHASNVLGTVNPLEKIIRIAHTHGAVVCVDGAQAFPHIALDMQALDCDFYTFSAHKAYGPTGVGALYGKSALLEKMPPYQGGGSMIEQVSFTKTTYAKLPHKFEAGTPPIAEVIGFGVAVDYLEKIGMETILYHEKSLLNYAMIELNKIKGLTILGTARDKLGVISFTLDGIHPHDIATILDIEGIAIRAGHHCAMPLMEYYRIPACARASFGIYTTPADIDALVSGLQSVLEVFHS